MTANLYQKGKFYTLPVSAIRDEGGNSFFIVSANNREYAIRMFDFQRREPSVRDIRELPCMVKEVHGDNIVFVQNFALMFRDRYVAGRKYPFVVRDEVGSSADGTRYYDVRDANGVPFRIKCDDGTLLLPNQKVTCMVLRPTANRMMLVLDREKGPATAQSIRPR